MGLHWGIYPFCLEGWDGMLFALDFATFEEGGRGGCRLSFPILIDRGWQKVPTRVPTSFPARD